jgi:hypothetical protein
VTVLHGSATDIIQRRKIVTFLLWESVASIVGPKKSRVTMRG